MGGTQDTALGCADPGNAAPQCGIFRDVGPECSIAHAKSYQVRQRDIILKYKLGDEL